MVCSCGRSITQPARGRRRTKCEACSPPDRRQRPDKLAPLVGSVVNLPQKRAGRLSLTARTLASLEEAGRVDTWQGEAALQAAELIDAREYTAQGAAALFKTHREALDFALAGAGDSADVIDLIFSDEA